MSRSIGLGRTLSKGAAGFLAGVAIWAGLSEPYHRTLAGPAQALIRTFESPPVTRLRAEKREIILDRDDFLPSSPRPGVPADDLDFNVAIFAALFASRRDPFSDAALRRLALGAGLLWLTHVAAIVFAVENIDATAMGEWSAAHYGWTARNFWATGHHFYRIAGMFAVPFALWWALARPEIATPEEGGPRRRKFGRRK